MKGIILAGGNGTRLHPLTISVSKQILPVFDKPMIYYPLSTLISMGVSDILIITNKQNLPVFKTLLEDGKKFGINISYELQNAPNGIAEALIIGEDFLNNENVVLILGDNIFISNNINSDSISDFNSGAKLFCVDVKKPERYGVVKYKDNGTIDSIVEKPENFISSKAVTGLYIYDKNASMLAKSLKPSNRGELEITDLNNLYISQGSMRIDDLGINSLWLDAGTFNSLKQSAEQISSQQSRSGLLLGSPEIESFKQGFIDKSFILERIDMSPKNEYFDLMLNNIEKYSR